MKLQLKDGKLYVTKIDRSGFLTSTRILNPEQATTYQKEDHLIIAFEKTSSQMTVLDIEKKKERMIELGALTEEEFNKYNNSDNWEQLPRLEFMIVDKID